ncbi:Pab1p-dependent poly(A) ribonuclease subunit [Trypanosoma brucei equiperdum]|uniref:Pab1p-dependent poly(A) ribonuclease subunit n=1 Tax=Trypanosoma brucei equiperdum TaxID=630700 RepID=A0A3L6KZK0_9TRYP|nr:Pab1p-dependent poly(A) ribonuclease subunit [Trypanosoma brucei equiperdum]
MDSKGRGSKANALGCANVVGTAANAVTNNNGNNSNQHPYARRHVNNSGGAFVNAFLASPTSLYNTPQPVDPYRQALSNPFPSAPYTTVGHLFMSSAVRNARPNVSFRSRSPARNTTVVTSPKFAHYTTIYNIENEASPSSMNPKVRTQVYQTTTRMAGTSMALRRLVKMSTTAEECAAVSELFRQYRHPNLVPLTNVLVTDEFVMGSADVIMEYKFITGAKSLNEAFINEGKATEGLLWSFACQMVSLMRAFHETSTPLRGLHWTKILFVPVSSRFYFSGVGFMDVMEPKGSAHQSAALMKHDIQSLGLLLLQLSTGNSNAKPEDFTAQPAKGYSGIFWLLVKACIDGTADVVTLCRALGERMSMEVAHQEGHADRLISQCGKEAHNGRIMRLMIKLNFVLESLHDFPEHSAEANNRYALRLFSQYVFNQVDERHRTRLDWGHVFHSLNKLDCGSEELVQLIGNDESNTILVISYRDLRDTLERAFEQLQPPPNEGDVQPFTVTVGTTSATL